MHGRRDRQPESRRAVALQLGRYRRGELFAGPCERLLRALVRRCAGGQGTDAEQRRARDGLHWRPAGRGRDVRTLRRLVRLGARDVYRCRDLCAVDQQRRLPRHRRHPHDGRLHGYSPRQQGCRERHHLREHPRRDRRPYARTRLPDRKGTGIRRSEPRVCAAPDEHFDCTQRLAARRDAGNGGPRDL